MTQSAADLRKRIREIVRKSYDDAGVYYAERATDAILALLQPERPKVKCELCQQEVYADMKPCIYCQPESPQPRKESVQDRLRPLHEWLIRAKQSAFAELVDDAAWALDSLETDLVLARQPAPLGVPERIAGGVRHTHSDESITTSHGTDYCDECGQRAYPGVPEREREALNEEALGRLEKELGEIHEILTDAGVPYSIPAGKGRFKILSLKKRIASLLERAPQPEP